MAYVSQVGVCCQVSGSPAGVRSARVMRWEERLAVLREARRWRHALLLALDILAAARTSAGLSLSPDPGQGQGRDGAAEAGNSGGTAARALPSRGDGRGADVTAVGSALIALLLGFLDASLASARPTRHCKSVTCPF